MTVKVKEVKQAATRAMLSSDGCLDFTVFKQGKDVLIRITSEVHEQVLTAVVNTIEQVALLFLEYTRAVNVIQYNPDNFNDIETKLKQEFQAL